VLRKVALICGGSGRVGSVIAKSLAADGRLVAIQYCHNSAAADLVASTIIASGGSAITLQANLCDETAVQKLASDTRQHWGGLHILVNAVHGQFSPKDVVDMEWEDWSVHLDALKGHFLVCKTVVPIMRSQHDGRIIFISGGLSKRLLRGCAAYTTIKAGLNGFCKTLALEEGRQGITVNIVAPGKVVMETGQASTDHPEVWKALNQQSLSHSPLGRDATGQDVANAVRYFASEGASCITGQTLFVTGGEIMP
jgi:3-oxoacyl-[acyl-carrier protein] reductase